MAVESFYAKGGPLIKEELRIRVGGAVEVKVAAF